MRIAIIISALLFALPVAAQQPLSYYKVDSLSYAYYTQNDAKNLRKIVNEANAAGIDYYYLRMRAGIVHYNKGNYEEAAYQFDKALNFFPIDTLAAEYLYFSYANAGRSFDANRTAKKLNTSQKERYGIKSKPVQSISIGGGYAFSDNQTKNGQLNMVNQGLAGYADNYMLNNSAFGQVGMVNNIAKNIKLFTAYSYYNLQNTHRMQSVIVGQGTVVDTAAGYTTTQNDVYISPTFYLGQGFYISPAFHFIQYNFNTYTRIYYPAPPKLAAVNVKQNLFYEGAEFGYRFKYGNIALSGGYSKFDTLNFFHGNIGLTYYPLGNTSLYGTTNLLYLGDQYDNFLAFTQKVGVKLVKNIWLEGGFATGNLRYFSEGNGYTIYTIPDEITMKLSGMLNCYISKHFSLSAGYIFLKREGAYLRSLNAYNYNINPYNYNNHVITTTLTITP